MAVLGGRGGEWYWHCGWKPDESRGLSAAYFAARWHSRRIDLKALQRVAILSCSPEAAYRFARGVPGANVRRLQDVVVRHGTPADMRKFALNVPGADAKFLDGMAVVVEVMSL